MNEAQKKQIRKQIIQDMIDKYADQNDIPGKHAPHREFAKAIGLERKSLTWAKDNGAQIGTLLTYAKRAGFHLSIDCDYNYELK